MKNMTKFINELSLPVKICVRQDEYVRQLIGKFKSIIKEMMKSIVLKSQYLHKKYLTTE